MPFTSEGIWKPDGIKQEAFLSLPKTVLEAVIGGGVQTGKTELLLIYGIAKGWHLLEGFKQLYLRRELNTIRNEVVPRSKNIFGKLTGWTFNATYMHWTYGPTGAMIFLGHCETEDDVHNYDTMEINLFTPDEMTLLTEFIYLYIALERVRSRPGSELPMVTRGAAMPGGIGHTWFKKRFVDAAPEGGKIIVSKGNRKLIYIHATLADSERVNEEYSQQLDALPEAERQAKKFGNWNAYTGQVFDEFRDRHYPSEPDNALHWIEPFDIPEWWPRIFINDWGFAALNYVLSLAISPNKRVYAYRERWWLKTKIAEWAPYIKEDISRESPRAYVICKSAKQDRGQEHTIQQDIETELGISTELSVNTPGSRINGKQLVHEYLRWKPKYVPHQEKPVYNHEHALWLMRNRGLVEYKSYLSSFDAQEPENNLPKLLIFNSLTKLKDAITACVYDKNNPEDVAEFDGDDPYDALRYGLDRVDRYFKDAKNEFDLIQKKEAITEEFQTTQNWNLLYRKARILEQSSGPKPVKRYHRGMRQ